MKQMLLFITLLCSFAIIVVAGETDELPNTYSSLGTSVSKEMQKLADKLSSKINSSEMKVRVLQMNGFLRHWFGEKNALVIPFLNYILVNEQWLKKLSPEARKFIIGRSLAVLVNYPEHAVLTSLFPALALLFTGPFYFLAIYFARQAEYSADKFAAEKFKCTSGAVDALEDMKSVPNWLNLVDFIPGASQIKNYLPGKLTNRTNKITNFFRDLPLIHYLSRVPKTEYRAEALEDILYQ